MEKWKAIPGFEGYEVSDQGNVRSYRKRNSKQLYSIPHLLKTTTDKKSGRQIVNLRHDGKTYLKRISPLVMLAFVSPRPDGMEVCHNNSNPKDDRLENLRYDTHLGNLRDRLDLSDAQVIEMRERRAKNRQQIKVIAEEFGIDYRQTENICRGRTFAGIGGIFTKGEHGKLTEDDVIAMRTERATSDITLKNLGIKYGLTESATSLICRGKRYPNTTGALTIGKKSYKNKQLTYSRKKIKSPTLQ